MTENKKTIKSNKYSVRYAARKHSFVLAVLVIVSLCIMALSYYCTGVVEKHLMNEIMEVRLDNLADAVDESIEERELIYNRFVDDCECKAQAIAVMIGQNPALIADEIGLEELLAVTGVDEITVADENGKVVRTTASSYDADVVLEEGFAEHADDKNFSQSVSVQRGDTDYVISGVSRRDADGILTIACSADMLRQIDEYTSISDVTSRYPLMENGITAIISAADMKYLSHTNVEFVGTVTDIPSEKLVSESGSFFCDVNGESCYVKYKNDGENIILGAVPKDEVYAGRNKVLKWLIFACVACCFAAALASRKVFLDKHKNEL